MLGQVVWGCALVCVLSTAVRRRKAHVCVFIMLADPRQQLSCDRSFAQQGMDGHFWWGPAQGAAYELTAAAPYCLLLVGAR
jgi:hypothetical protein